MSVATHARPQSSIAAEMGVGWRGTIALDLRHRPVVPDANAYCLAIDGNCMAPAAGDGDLAIVSPAMPLTIGGLVVVWLCDGPPLLKSLARLPAMQLRCAPSNLVGSLWLETTSPPCAFRLRADLVRAVHAVSSIAPAGTFEAGRERSEAAASMRGVSRLLSAGPDGSKWETAALFMARMGREQTCSASLPSSRRTRPSGARVAGADADAIVIRLCAEARRQAADVAHAVAELAEAAPALWKAAEARLAELSRTQTRTLRTIANMPAVSVLAIEAKACAMRGRSSACRDGVA